MSTDRVLVDHLVVAAATLAQGVAWCESTLGVSPGPGGLHPLMGTHNRLLNISSPGFPAAYLEIVAINPDAPAPGRPRWFGLDDPLLQAQTRLEPRLIHAVARTASLALQHQQLRQAGQELGDILAASRETPQGRLSWQITVPADGTLPGQGALPTLIQWQGAHPTEHMPASGITLQGLQWQGLAEAARVCLGFVSVLTSPGPEPLLQATLNTPLGLRVLRNRD